MLLGYILVYPTKNVWKRENRNYNKIPTENLIKMTQFILKKNNYFEFDSTVCH